MAMENPNFQQEIHLQMVFFVSIAMLVLRGGYISYDPFRGSLDVPLPTYPYWKSLYKPYITWVFMGKLSPRIPRLNTINTMVVHVR